MRGDGDGWIGGGGFYFDDGLSGFAGDVDDGSYVVAGRFPPWLVWKGVVCECEFVSRIDGEVDSGCSRDLGEPCGVYDKGETFSEGGIHVQEFDTDAGPASC